jgi:hypothetical protein
MIPVTVRLGDQERAAGWFVDFAVLPGYQGKGIGLRLTKEWTSCSPVGLTFCNEKSMRVFSKLGWQARFDTRSFRLPLRPEKHPKLSGAARPFGSLAGVGIRTVWGARSLRANQLTVSPASAGPLNCIPRLTLAASLYVPRRPDFFDWFVLRNPNAAEYFVVNYAHKKDGHYAAVVRVYDRRGFRRLHILTVRAERFSRPGLSDFFGSIARWAIRSGIHDIWLVSSHPLVFAAARRWFPIQQRLRFAFHAGTHGEHERLSAGSHLWETMDSDFDLEYV